MLIPFGTGKLAQKGRAFASKRNAAIFLISAAPGVAMHRAAWANSLWEDTHAIAGEVFLDGAETKSEDCLTGAGTCVLNA
jgi:hypothetical protein